MRQTVRRWLQFAVCHTKGSAHASHGCRRKVNKDGTERKVAAASDRKVGIEFHYAKLKYGTKSFCARLLWNDPVIKIVFCENTRLEERFSMFFQKQNQPHSCLRQTITLRRTHHADPCVDTPAREWLRRRRCQIEKERLRGLGGSRSGRLRRFRRRCSSPG